MIDLAGLVPEARPIVEQAANIYLSQTQPWLVGILAHGSAVKGGFIPGCSDIDLQLYLDDAAFATGFLPLQVCENIQRELAEIDPAPFGYIQCYAFSAAHGNPKHKDWLGPVPGTYHILVGRLPVPEATSEQLLSAARKRLYRISADIASSQAALLDHGSGGLQRQIRLICTSVWPTLNQVLSLQNEDPLRVWNLTKLQALEEVDPNTALGTAIRSFYRAVTAYYPAQSSLEAGLAVMRYGINFLQAANEWWQYYQERGEG